MTCLQGKKVREERGAAASFCGPCRRSGAREAGSVSPGTLLGPGSRQRGRVPPRSIPAAAAASRFCIPQVGARELPPRCPTARAGGGGVGWGGHRVPGSPGSFLRRQALGGGRAARADVGERGQVGRSSAGRLGGRRGAGTTSPGLCGGEHPHPARSGGRATSACPGEGGVSCLLGPGLRLGALNGPWWPADDDTAP